MKQSKHDDGFPLSDRLWGRMEPLLPVSKALALSCYRPRVPNRAAMDAIQLVLRTGMQWNALDGAGRYSCTSEYRRFRESNVFGLTFRQAAIGRFLPTNCD